MYNKIYDYEADTVKIDKLVKNYEDIEKDVEDLKENQTDLSDQIDAVEDEIENTNNDVSTLAGVAKTVETITFKITPADWNGSLEYTYENEALGLDKLIEVTPTTDGTVVDGVTVSGNAVYIGSYVIEPTAQTSEGQLTFKAQSSPTVNVYITLVVWSNGISLE